MITDIWNLLSRMLQRAFHDLDSGAHILWADVKVYFLESIEHQFWGVENEIIARHIAESAYATYIRIYETLCDKSDEKLRAAAFAQAQNDYVLDLARKIK